MPRYYIDTAGQMALIDRRDRHHESATRIMRELTQSPMNIFFTSEAVLIELLTYFSNKGSHLREEVCAYVERLSAASPMLVMPQTPALFAAAFDLYRRRRDKTYSMVDCIGMVICHEQDIADILTADDDFAQERLRKLL